MQKCSKNFFSEIIETPTQKNFQAKIQFSDLGVLKGENIIREVFQRPIYNPVEHLQWSFVAIIVTCSKPLTIFAKKLHHVLLGSEYASVFNTKIHLHGRLLK